MRNLYSLILLISSSVLASVTAAQDSAAALADEIEQSVAVESPAANIQTRRSSLVERNILAAQAVQLSADAQQLITLSTPREHFSALFLAANQAKPRGLLILLPGNGETFDWPDAVGPLRSKLPDAGWHTLSLNLPPPPPLALSLEPVLASPVAEQIIIEPPVSATPAEIEDSTESETPTEAEEAEPEPEDEVDAAAEEATAAATPEESPAEADEPVIEALPPLTHPERINSFIEAAIDYAQQLQVTDIILLGHHEGAYWALRYATLQTSKTPQRVALIAPRASPQDLSSYENLIQANALPIADFYYKGDRVTETEAKQRLQASKRAGSEQYHQVGLTAAQPLEQEQLFRRVKGWLNK